MKKNPSLILTTVLILFAIVSYGQKGYVYDDAATLYNSLNTKSTESVDEIIAYYAPDKPHATREQINKIINDNPFLSQNALLKKYASETTALKKNEEGEPSGVGSGFMGLNVTKYADGIAKFLIERGKQELSMAFFDKMREDFKVYPELRTLFPQTVGILEGIENHNILTLLQELKDALSKDLLRAPENVLALRDLKEFDCTKVEIKNCSGRNESIKTIQTAANRKASVISLLVAQGIIDGNNVITILSQIATDSKFCSGNDDIDGYLKFSYLLMDMLRNSKETGGPFISETNMKEIFVVEEFLKIFIGLGYEKFNNMTCFNETNLKIDKKSLKEVFQAILGGRTQFINALITLDKVNLAYVTIKKQINDVNGTDKGGYASYVSSSMMIIDNMVKGTQNILNIKSLPKDVERVLANTHITADLLVDINQRNYAGIFNDATRFISVNKIISSKDSVVVKAKIVKYMSFAANMASAQNSDEVKDALNAATLPPGSFSVKQKTAYNIAVNAYVGYAWDFNDGLYGRNVYAPIGFTFSKGLSKKHGGALSVFGSLIDVGALVSYRLTNGMADSLKQEVRLESIISPSAQLIYAIPKLPISICAGWRRTPRLIYEGQREFTVLKPKDVFNVSILIDIPMFNLWTQPYE